MSIKVSIVIAILNSHKVVVRQLRHFKKMRLPRDVEFIFVDDGSNPPLGHQNCGLRNFKVLFTNDKRPWTQGLARNLGVSKATGTYVFLTDIDHILTREAIEAARNFKGDKMVFERRYGILDRRGTIINDLDSMLKFGLNPVRTTHRGLSAGTHGNTYVIRKTVFERIGGYNPLYCEMGFHVGGKYMSEERQFNIKWNRLENRGKVIPHSIGPNVYFFPVRKFRMDGNNNPFGLFHGLSLEQTPQPMKG